ncbi:hypothetical protein O6P43_032341 [Quillaja saponaria]|uniref:Uncharacterized protein n=1 Tax=Quillaja saponaria TaxID=32244 RepID=A0AAD7P5J0_QUISA|nr:hypothetical protein O6P43_032341 [Quillaja saponaria]
MAMKMIHKRRASISSHGSNRPCILVALIGWLCSVPPFPHFSAFLPSKREPPWWQNAWQLVVLRTFQRLCRLDELTSLICELAHLPSL